MKHSLRVIGRSVASNGALALFYFGAAKLGLSLAALHPSVSSVWPPSAIGLAAALLIGPSCWPGLLAGAFAINFLTVWGRGDASVAACVLSSAGIAAGNTLEAVVAAWAVSRFAGGTRVMEHAADFLKLTLFAALLATTISASVGTLSLAATGLLQWANLVPAWATWWLGDAAGMLLWAPLPLAWLSRSPQRVAGYAEAAMLALYSAAYVWLAFSVTQRYPIAFIIMPGIIWSAFRFGMRGTTVWVSVVSCAAIAGTAAGRGPFAMGLATDMMVLQIFLGTLAVCSYTTAALVWEKERAEGDLRSSRDRLESEVDRRTRELLQAQKMEAVGRLSGVVAHEFNNALTGIAGLAELIRQDASADSQTARDAQDIAGACRRGAALAGRLLSLSRRRSQERKAVDLHELIEANAKILRMAVGERAELKVSLGPSPSTVLAVRDQLEQVLLNLCLNARDAMSGAGTIEITTSGATVPADRILSHGALRTGEYRVLALSDTGSGIRADILPMIFEPFFTTKRAEHGSGLGLSVVYAIVDSSDGAIDVETGPRGTVFRLYLPATNAVAERTPAPAAKRTQPRGTETILVADDDALVRAILVRALEPLGYELLVARDGEEAWRLYQENESRVALALLDVVMPRLRGDEVYARIAEKKPGFKVLFVSGHATHQADEAVRRGKLPLIKKPFPLDEIGVRVREILDGR